MLTWMNLVSLSFLVVALAEESAFEECPLTLNINRSIRNLGFHRLVLGRSCAQSGRRKTSWSYSHKQIFSFQTSPSMKNMIALVSPCVHFEYIVPFCRIRANPILIFSWYLPAIAFSSSKIFTFPCCGLCVLALTKTFPNISSSTSTFPFQEHRLFFRDVGR